MEKNFSILARNKFRMLVSLSIFVNLFFANKSIAQGLLKSPVLPERYHEVCINEALKAGAYQKATKDGDEYINNTLPTYFNTAFEPNHRGVQEWKKQAGHLHEKNSALDAPMLQNSADIAAKAFGESGAIARNSVSMAQSAQAAVNEIIGYNVDCQALISDRLNELEKQNKQIDEHVKNFNTFAPLFLGVNSPPVQQLGTTIAKTIAGQNSAPWVSFASYLTLSVGTLYMSIKGPIGKFNQETQKDDNSSYDKENKSRSNNAINLYKTIGASIVLVEGYISAASAYSLPATPTPDQIALFNAYHLSRKPIIWVEFAAIAAALVAAKKEITEASESVDKQIEDAQVSQSFFNNDNGSLNKNLSSAKRQEGTASQLAEADNEGLRVSASARDVTYKPEIAGNPENHLHINPEFIRKPSKTSKSISNLSPSEKTP